MAKVLVLYYSMYGHIEAMARAVAEGARSVEGTEVNIKRVPDLIPEQAARKAGARTDQEAPIAAVEDLPEYDAIIRMVIGLRDVQYCPHGRPIATAITRRSLDRQFGRIQ